MSKAATSYPIGHGLAPEPMCIVCASDHNYAQHLGVTLCSLFENCATPTALEIFILDAGLTDEDRRRLAALADSHGAGLAFVPADVTAYTGLPVTARITPSTYCRLEIPDLLPDRYDKALYLDSDLIVLEDLRPLWDTQLRRRALAAVKEPFPPDYEQLQLPTDIRCFNAGVMLLNLAFWREQQVGCHALDVARHEPQRIRFGEQDALNIVVAGNWVPLDPRWNLNTQFFDYAMLYRDDPATAPIHAAIRNPAVVHFTTALKPWHFVDRHRYKHLYYKYLARTEWRGYRPPDRTFVNLFRKYGPVTRYRLRKAWRMVMALLGQRR